MQCRVTSITTLALCGTTKEEKVMDTLEVTEEVEDVEEVMDKSTAIAADNKDTMQETVPTPPQYVSIANPISMLLKNVLFCKISGTKRDHRWETRMSS